MRLVPSASARNFVGEPLASSCGADVPGSGLMPSWRPAFRHPWRSASNDRNGQNPKLRSVLTFSRVFSRVLTAAREYARRRTASRKLARNSRRTQGTPQGYQESRVSTETPTPPNPWEHGNRGPPPSECRWYLGLPKFKTGKDVTQFSASFMIPVFNNIATAPRELMHYQSGRRPRVP